MKQVILVRQDLKMQKGKLSAQVAHASVDAVLKSNKNKVSYSIQTLCKSGNEQHNKWKRLYLCTSF